MAIFGTVHIWYPNKTFGELVSLRERNDGDVFLNYFFAVLFVICFLVGVIIDPLIILYHSKQKTTFAKVLFLLISVIDLIRSIYFPLVLVPKLLSPLDEHGLYYDDEPTYFHWTSYGNPIIFTVLDVQQEILVTLCVSRYFTIKDPLSTAKKRVFLLCVFVVGVFIANLGFLILEYSPNKLGYLKILDSAFSSDDKHVKEVLAVGFIFGNIVRSLFLLIGGVFSGLTILHLKRSDTAACESSEKNVRKGIIAIVAMNVFNVFVIIVSICFAILIRNLTKKLESENEADLLNAFSTWTDFLFFAATYGITLAQSAFNSLSFLFICKSFRDFVNKIIPAWRESVNVRHEVSVNPTVARETTVM